MSKFFNFLLVSCLLMGILGLATPVFAKESKAGLISPETLLNRDGTLDLQENAMGTLDLEGWDVEMDPLMGPTFTPVAGNNGWAAVGTMNAPFNGGINTIVVNGTDIYVGGSFTNAGGNPAADYIAKWNGSQWVGLSNDGSGNGAVKGNVKEMLFIGSDLYVGGYLDVRNTSGVAISYAESLAKWNGTAWSALPGLSASLNLDIWAMEYHAASTSLYIGGGMTNIKGIPEADRIIKVNLSTGTWSALGSNGTGDGSINNTVTGIAFDSSGNVYVTGYFVNVNNNGVVIPEADRIAKWDGSSWSALGGSGDGVLSSTVSAIAIDVNDNLYISGGFNTISGAPGSAGFAKWDGASWSGANFYDDLYYPSGNGMREILVVGTDLYMSGNVAGSNALSNVRGFVKYDTLTNTWSGFGGNGTGGSSINNDGDGIAFANGKLYAGGFFTNVINNGSMIPAADYFAIWDGATWSMLGDPSGALNAQVNAIAVIGSDVFVGGNFTDLGGVSYVDYIARWDGEGWNGISNGAALNGPVSALAVDGTDLYVGGGFTNVYDSASNAQIPAADRIVRWDGSHWYALGSGNGGDGSLTNGSVNTIAIDGSTVYVGGSFTDVISSGTALGAADYIAKFDGTNWSSLGSNNASDGSLSAAVNAIEIGSSGQVYAGGGFTNVNNNGTSLPQADYIAQWDGSNWSAMTSFSLSNAVYALERFGNDLYVGGSFQNVNAIGETDYFARVDLTTNTWSAVDNNPSGISAFNGAVRTILVRGNRIFVGGEFTNLVVNGGVTSVIDYIAEWNGTQWNALGNNGSTNGSLNNFVYTLGTENNDLYAGGAFINVTNSDGVIVKDADYVSGYGIEALPVTVTINQGAMQTDPYSSANQIAFDVVFSEPVVGFDAFNDVLISGTGAGYVDWYEGSGATYTVYTYADMPGTVIASIPASVVTGIYGGLDNLESTSTDNEVTFAPQMALSSIPSLLSPSSGGTFVSGNDITLDWSNSTPAPYYYNLLIATTNAFDASVVTSTWTENSICDNCNFGLQPGKLYYWKVQATNYNGQTKGWSVIRSFKIGLEKPSLVSPSLGAGLLTNTASFDWDTVTGAASYQIQVSQYANFSTLLINATTTDTAYTTTKQLPRNKIIYWRVLAKTTQVKSAWMSSSFTTGNPPTVPGLVSPANNALTTKLQPKLDWNTSTVSSGAIFDHYQLQVATDNLFSNLVVDQNILGASNSFFSSFASDLLPNTTYYWHVRSFNTLGQYSSWSATWKFRTALSVPVNLSVTGNDVSLQPTFNWDDSLQPGVSGYNIQISTSPTFVSIVINSNTIASQYIPSGAIPQNKTIYWRARVLGVNGPSLWTDGSSFLSVNPPSVPVLSSPASNALITNYTPTFKWLAVTLPATTSLHHYQIQVDDSSSFDSPEVDQNVNTTQLISPATLTPNTKYYWRVRAFDNLAQYSRWSAVWIVRAAIAPPALNSPGNLDTGVSRMPLFKWSDVSGANGYVIQISTSSMFGTLLVNSSTATNTYTPPTNLPASKTIYWRVRTKSANGPSVWATFQFVTGP